MIKHSVLASLGKYYAENLTGYSELKFTLNNVTEFSAQLVSMSWDVAPALLDTNAGKNIILEKLSETINNCQNDDDWLLFYFTGHASRIMTRSADGGADFITYCVTYSENLKVNSFPGLNAFLTEVDYDDIINEFHQRVPKGHLLTVLDCCNAFGLIENFSNQTAFHTVIAASADGIQGRFNTNSSFFTAFRQCWGTPFNLLAGRLRSIMTRIKSPNMPVVKIASDFINQSLNT